VGTNDDAWPAARYKTEPTTKLAVVNAWFNPIVVSPRLLSVRSANVTVLWTRYTLAVVRVQKLIYCKLATRDVYQNVLLCGNKQCDVCICLFGSAVM